MSKDKASALFCFTMFMCCFITGMVSLFGAGYAEHHELWFYKPLKNIYGMSMVFSVVSGIFAFTYIYLEAVNVANKSGD